MRLFGRAETREEMLARIQKKVEEESRKKTQLEEVRKSLEEIIPAEIKAYWKDWAERNPIEVVVFDGSFNLKKSTDELWHRYYSMLPTVSGVNNSDVIQKAFPSVWYGKAKFSINEAVSKFNEMGYIVTDFASTKDGGEHAVMRNIGNLLRQNGVKEPDISLIIEPYLKGADTWWIQNRLKAVDKNIMLLQVIVGKLGEIDAKTTLDSFDSYNFESLKEQLEHAKSRVNANKLDADMKNDWNSSVALAEMLVTSVARKFDVNGVTKDGAETTV